MKSLISSARKGAQSSNLSNKRSWQRTAIQCAVASIALGGTYAHGAIFTWDGGGGNGNFSTGANWNPDGAPTATGSNLVFAGTANLAANNDLVTNVATSGVGITFDATAGSFTISGNTMVLGSGGGAGQVIFQQSSTADQTISANINLSGGNGDRQIVFGAGAGKLILSGNINFGTSNGDWLFPTTTAGTIVLSGNNTGDGKLTAAVTSGTNVLRAMMRNNVAGTNLVLGSNTALGNIGTGDAAGGTAAFRGLVANQQLNISTTGGDRDLSGSTLAINANNITFNGTNNFTIGNVMVVSGNRDFVVSSTGQVTVSNGIFVSNDQTGRALYMNLSGAGGLILNGKLYDTFHSGGVTTGTINFRKAGTGTLTLNGDSSNYNGVINLEGGTTKLGHANALGATGTTKGTTLTGNATLDFSGQTIAETLTINNNGNALLNTSTTAAAGSADITMNAPLTINTAGDLTLTRLIGTSTTRTVTKLGNGTLTTNGTSHNNLAAWDIQAGTVVFANTTGYGADRGVTLNGGTLKLSGLNSDLVNDGQAFTINSGTFDLNGKGEAVAAISGAGGTITNTSATTATLYVGGGAGGTSSGATGASIANGTGTLNVTKEGTGTQTLTGALTYTGPTTVSKGTLLINTALANSSSVSVASAGFIGGTGSIANSVTVGAGGGVTPGGSGAIGNLTIGGNLNLNATSSTTWEFDNLGAIGTAGTNYDLLTLTGASSTLTLGGTVNVALTNGDFTNAFWDTNQSFTITNVTNTLGTTGSVAVSAPSATGQGAFATSVVGGNLVLNWTAIAGLGSWIGTNGGSWGDTASWAAGSLPASNFNLEFGAAGAGGVVNLDGLRGAANPASIALANGSGGIGYNLTAGSGGTLSLTGDVGVGIANGSETHTISAPVGGTGALTKTGPGILVLSGSNSYTGSTTINAGTLAVGNASAVGASPITVNTGATLDLNGTNVSLGAGLSGAGTSTVTSASAATLSLSQSATTAFAGNITGAVSVNKSGTGTITLSASNSYSGNTTLSNGTVIVPNNQYSPFGTGTVTLAGSSTTTPVITTTPGSGGYATSNASRITNDIVVQAGSTNVIDNSASAFGNLWFGGSWTGTGKVVFEDNNASTSTFTSSSAALFIGDKLGGFQGTIELGTVANPAARSWAFVAMSDDGSSPVTQWDASQATVILGNNPTGGAGIIKWNQSANGGTIKLGSLEGQSPRSFLQGGNGVPVTFEIGALNTNKTFAGQIIDGTSGPTSVTKVGTGTQILTGLAKSGTGVYTGATTVNNGTLEVNVIPTSSSSVVINGGTLAVTASDGDGAGPGIRGAAGSVSRLSNLTIGVSGKLDLKNNGLIIPAAGNLNGSAITVDTLRAAIIAGRGGVGTGAATWSGAGGIGTSVFAFDETFDSIGYCWTGDPNLLVGPTDVNGESYDAGDYVVKYCAGADADLNGLVDDTDVAVIGLTYDGGASTGHHWYEGDFNYDGLINDDDVAIIGLAYNPSATPLSPSFYAALSAEYGSSFASAFAAGAAGTVVPEPASLGLLAVGAMGLLRRRRK